MPTIKPNSAQKISRNSGKLATCVCFQFFYNNNSICAITFKQLIGLEWNQLHLKDNNKTYNFFCLHDYQKSSDPYHIRIYLLSLNLTNDKRKTTTYFTTYILFLLYRLLLSKPAKMVYHHEDDDLGLAYRYHGARESEGE